MCHINRMKAITIRDLHMMTGRHVRAAQLEPVIVTEHGKRVAVLKAFSEAELTGVPFPRRRAVSLPQVRIDTTALIADDRSGR